MGSAIVILESVCTTQSIDGQLNIAPMGPVVDESFTSMLLRPFQSSTTFRNLQATRCGVIHVTDDVDLIARAAIHDWASTPCTFAAKSIDGRVIADACRWYEFEVVAIDDSQPRSEITTRITHTGRLRDFWGFNRAKHAILEAAILATRLHLLPADDLLRQYDELRIIVEKTASPADAATFKRLHTSVSKQLNRD